MGTYTVKIRTIDTEIKIEGMPKCLCGHEFLTRKHISYYRKTNEGVSAICTNPNCDRDQKTFLQWTEEDLVKGVIKNQTLWKQLDSEYEKWNQNRFLKK